MKPAVVCQPLSKFDMFNCVCVTYSVPLNIFFMLRGGVQILDLWCVEKGEGGQPRRKLWDT